MQFTQLLKNKSWRQKRWSDLHSTGVGHIDKDGQERRISTCSEWVGAFRFYGFKASADVQDIDGDVVQLTNMKVLMSDKLKPFSFGFKYSYSQSEFTDV
jgi:hypothetical protein